MQAGVREHGTELMRMRLETEHRVVGERVEVKLAQHPIAALVRMRRTPRQSLRDCRRRGRHWGDVARVLERSLVGRGRRRVRRILGQQQLAVSGDRTFAISIEVNGLLDCTASLRTRNT